ncbi:hypothetical protein F5884DRAFT_445870 [Xylogone sp. PMI_703]|nr:hypothetical protein F5884DRAFT_445870 [Xylogone sp. PMI_703]
MSGQTTGQDAEQEFLFIDNTGLRSKPSEASSSRLVIRSRAGTHGRRRVQPEASNNKKNASSKDDKPWQPFHKMRIGHASKRGRRTQKSDMRVDNSKSPQDAAASEQSHLLQALMRTAIENIGIASFDPFHTLPAITLPDSVLSSCINFTVSTIYPEIFPGKKGDELQNQIQRLFNVVRTHAISFYAMIYGSLCHQRALNRGLNITVLPSIEKRNQYYGLYAQYRAIQLLRQEVETSPTHIPEAVLMAMLYLGCHQWEEMNPARMSDFQPSIEYLGNQAVWIQFEPEDSHVYAVFSMMQNQGGIQSLSIPELSGSFSYADVLHATRRGCKPILDFIPYSPSTSPTLQSMLNFNWSDVERDFGVYRSIGLSDNMLEVFQAMKELEKKLNPTTGAEFALYTDQRNITQYYILSLPQVDTTRNIHWKDAVYEACRLALILYSMGVTFPMTLTAGPWSRLATELHTLLKDNYSTLAVEESYHSAEFTLIRWAVTIGGIAAYETSYRPYFVLLLSKLLPASLILSGSFEDFKSNTLKKILWLDSACDVAGQRIWEEIGFFCQIGLNK